MKPTMILTAILLVAACSTAGQPDRDREARVDRDTDPPQGGPGARVGADLAPPDPRRDAATKRDIATHLTEHARWCLAEQLVDEARDTAIEAGEADPTYPPLRDVMLQVVAAAPGTVTVSAAEIDRRRRELGDAVGRQYLSLFQWGQKPREQPTYDRYLRRAFQHDPARATAFFDALWDKSLRSRDWSRLRRLCAVLATTTVGPDTMLERLRALYAANPPAAQRALYDRALLETYALRPEAVGPIVEAEWRAARTAGDYARARHLLGRAHEVRPSDGARRLLDEVEQLELDRLRAQVVPGGQFVIRFPELGPTMRGPDHVMEMGVALPADYSAAGRWALVLSLGGGNGMSKPIRGLAAGLPAISIGLTYPLDPQNPTSIAPNPSLLWPMYEVMLAKLARVVPNIDPDRRVVFGFSNGAHSITGLIAESDLEFQQMFRYMVVVEGGTFLRKWTEVEWQSLQGNRFLFAGSDRGGKTQAKALHRWAEQRGIDAELFVFPGGHEMTPALVTKVRAWIGLEVFGRRAAADSVRTRPPAARGRPPA